MKILEKLIIKDGIYTSIFNDGTKESLTSKDYYKKYRDITKTKIERRGGKRKGAGHPFKYGEETINVTFRIPNSRKEEVKEIVYNFLKQFETKKK